MRPSLVELGAAGHVSLGRVVDEHERLECAGETGGGYRPGHVSYGSFGV